MRPGRQVRVTGQEAIRSGADRKRMNEHSEPTRAREGGGRNRHVHAMGVRGPAETDWMEKGYNVTERTSLRSSRQ